LGLGRKTDSVQKTCARGGGEGEGGHWAGTSPKRKWCGHGLVEKGDRVCMSDAERRIKKRFGKEERNYGHKRDQKDKGGEGKNSWVEKTDL